MPLPSEVLPSAILEAATRLLVELCGISSSSGDLAGLRRLADRVGSELGRRGLVARVAEEPDEEGMLQPVLLARGPAATEHPLVLVGHLDTVLAAAPPGGLGHVRPGHGQAQPSVLERRST